MALQEVPGHRHTPADLPPRKRHGITYTGGWEDIRALLDGSGKSRPIGVRPPETSSLKRVAIQTALRRLPMRCVVGHQYFKLLDVMYLTVKVWS